MKQRHFVVCTEYFATLGRHIGRYFDAFFVVRGQGCWHGQREQGCQIHLTLDDTLDSAHKVRCLAEDVKQVYAQQAVLVLDYEVNAEYV